MITRLLLNGLYGMFAGFAWAFALDKQFKSGLFYGLIIGVIVGLVLHLVIAVRRVPANVTNVTKEDSAFVMNTQSTLLLMAAITTALITWVIRIIFL